MKTTFLSGLCALAIATTATAQLPLDLPDGKDWNIADVFTPSIHLNVAAGDSSEEPEDLAVGGHDPSREFTVQAFEVGLSLRLNEHIEAFANHAWSYGASEDWVDEWEEIFGKLTGLPGGFELRGGQMLNRFGILNAKHLHAWNTVDVPLVNGRMLGEEGLVTEGGDVTWYLPTPFKSALTVGYGEALAHGHEEEGHDEGEDEDGHDDEEEEEEHGHNEAAEEAGFEDDVFSINLTTQIPYNDFHRYDVGASFASGDNGLGDDTEIFGIHLTYLWRENGLEPGGRHFTWNNEFMIRDIKGGEGHGHGEEEEEHHDEEEEEHHDEDEEEHDEDEEEFEDADEFGFYTELIYGPTDLIDIGTRVGFVEGIDELGIGERFRISPWLTVYLTESRNAHIRFQYNYDDLDGEDAHSGWVQLQYSLGPKEVR
ncbi:MAG: hypothetical protein AAF492_00635 [Verrucomicrobiota bacterium]